MGHDIKNTMQKKSKKIKEEIYHQIVHFIYETNIHSKTPRSGFWFLGSGQQSVAEHLFHATMIAYALCYLDPHANKDKVILMALLHDIGEGRTSDHNYIHQRYGRLAEAEAEAVKDIAAALPFGDEIKKLFEEEQEKKTLEAKLVKDADQLEWIATLRAEEAKGNTKAKKWIAIAVKRLKTSSGKKLGKLLVKTNPDGWWFNEGDSWWVDRRSNNRKWNAKKR